MTERQQRLMRLTELRGKQHDRAVVDLRAAHHQLHLAQKAVESGVQRARAVRTLRDAALLEAAAEDWLLACAGEAIAAMQVRRGGDFCVAAEREVASAAERETEARRDFRQMEVTVERMQREESVLSARREQRGLDECAQLLRIRSSKQVSALERA